MNDESDDQPEDNLRNLQRELGRQAPRRPSSSGNPIRNKPSDRKFAREHFKYEPSPTAIDDDAWRGFWCFWIVLILLGFFPPLALAVMIWKAWDEDTSYRRGMLIGFLVLVGLLVLLAGICIAIYSKSNTH